MSRRIAGYRRPALAAAIRRGGGQGDVVGWPAIMLRLAAFLSGAAALLFETLWFRQAALAFGNTVWAASLVLAAFMAGLGIGNVWAAHSGGRLTRPVRAYSIIELLIGGTGLAVAWSLPHLGPVFAPLFGPLQGRPLALNTLRFALSSALLMAPAVAMGATLPLLVRGFLAQRPGFGSALGQLYGWNTLGAVAGALAGEGLLISVLGLRGTGLAAAALNAGAALLAWLWAREMVGADVDARPSPAWAGPASLGILTSAAVCGAILLAFEVVWFRFMLLFVLGTNTAFAAMLAVVLAGIALGGLVASAILRRLPGAHRAAPLVALLAGTCAVATFSLFRFATRDPQVTDRFGVVAVLCVPLFFPVAFLSGGLFTLLGAALQERVGEAARATGALTLANTFGATLGSLAAALVLLPRLGLERSFFVLAAGYGIAALAAWPRGSTRRAVRWVDGAVVLAYVLALAFFPFGLMNRAYLGRVVARFERMGYRLVAQREGLTETAQYLRRDFLGRPLIVSLVTNGHPMSDTSWSARRYMALFSHLPLALRETPPTRALLICYGVGSTARSLVAHRELAEIDVVDISRTVLDMAGLTASPDGNPLEDPRVGVHVEDGRFFLQTTKKRYDLITGEPPPPKHAGIVNLYTREHFSLIRERLTDGGMASYWLPMVLLDSRDAKAIVSAFCSVFDDCTLWSGSGLEWILLGSRGASSPVSGSALGRPWREPPVAAELVALGFEGPHSLGATFLGDSEFLEDWVGATPALVDDHPLRISPGYPDPGRRDPDILGVMEARRSRGRFESSAWVRRVWPGELRESTLGAFSEMAALNEGLVPSTEPWWRTLGKMQELSSSPIGPLLLLSSSPDAQRILRSATSEERASSGALYQQAIGELAVGDDAAAERSLAIVLGRNPEAERVAQLRALALLRSGRRVQAAEVASSWKPRSDGEAADFWSWVGERCETGP
jgi:spermidine synthase